FLGQFDILGKGVLGQVLMRPGVIADGHSGRGDFPGYIGSPRRVLTDLEERRLDAVVLERFQHHRRIFRPRTVVEGQHDFFVAQEVVLLEVLGPEGRPAGGVDFNDARQTDGVGIIASGNGFGGGRGRRGRRRGWRRWRSVLSECGWRGCARLSSGSRLRNLSYGRGWPSRLCRNGLTRRRRVVALPGRDYVDSKCDE